MSFVAITHSGVKFFAWPPESAKPVVHQISRWNLSHHKWCILQKHDGGPEALDVLHRHAVMQWQPVSSAAAAERATLAQLSVFCLFGATVTYSAYFDILEFPGPQTPLLLFITFLTFAMTSVLNLIRLWDHNSVLRLGVRFVHVGILRALTIFATSLLLVGILLDYCITSVVIAVPVAILALGVTIGCIIYGRRVLLRQLQIEDYPHNRATIFLQVYDLYGGAMRYVREVVPDYATHTPEEQVGFLLTSLKTFLPRYVITGAATPACFIEVARDAPRWYLAAEALRTRSVEDFSRMTFEQRVKRLLSLEKVLDGKSSSDSMGSIDGNESTRPGAPLPSTMAGTTGEPRSRIPDSIELGEITTPLQRQPVHDIYATSWSDGHGHRGRSPTESVRVADPAEHSTLIV